MHAVPPPEETPTPQALSPSDSSAVSIDDTSNHVGAITSLCVALTLLAGLGFGSLPGLLPWVVGGTWILFCGFVVRTVVQHWLRSLDALADSAQRIAAGETTLTLPQGRGSRAIQVLTNVMTQLLGRVERHRLELEQANERLRAKNIELQAANEVLSQLSITDGLTKMHNHRHFQDLLQSEARRVSRSGEPLSLILLDLDDFKRLNDRHGHAAGDEVLAWVARVLSEHVRETDVLARYGGEEFTVLCIDTDLAGAQILAEKLRLAIQETEFGITDELQRVPVSVSAGVAQFRGDARALFAAADRALYRAKAEGKNCVVAEDRSDPTAD